METYTYRLLLGVILAFCSTSQPTSAQELTIQAFPSDQQLFARQVSTNLASIPVSGLVKQESGFEKMVLEIKRDEVVVASLEHKLEYLSGVADFSFAPSIPAELADYAFILWGIANGTPQFLQQAKEVVAGDIYLINGQSNAEALVAPHPSDLTPYARSYTSSGWTTIQFSNPGQWGARIARRIVEEQGIPVAIFNDAVGAKPISFYLKDQADPDSGNYGAQRQRLIDAGIGSKVRGAFWFQGETDGWQTSTEQYEERLIQLANDWMSDYEIEEVYVYQIRRFSCTHPHPFVMEAQRRAAVHQTHIHLMSTTNAAHDGCHFPYENGYQQLGDRMYDLVAKYQYAAPIPAVDPPLIEQAEWLEDQQIRIHLQDDQQLSVLGNPWPEFFLEGCSAQITNGSVDNHQILLQWSGDTTGVSGISYLSHKGHAPDYVINQRTVGMATFFNFPILPASTDGDDQGGMGSTGGLGSIEEIDLEIQWTADDLAGMIGEDQMYTLTVKNTGPAAATGIRIAVHPSDSNHLAYTKHVLSQGTFEWSSHKWQLDQLNPGAQASLDLTLMALTEMPVLYSQIIQANQHDVDSRPANGVCCNAREDDEAVLQLTAQPKVEDTIPPRCTLFSVATTISAPFEVQARFSESVFHLRATDFVLSNGSLEAFSGQDSSYQLLIRPHLPGLVTVQLPAQTARDTAENGNQASNRLDVRYQPPTSPFIDLEVSLSSPQTVYDPYQNMTYLLQIRNSGPAVATDILVEVDRPESLGASQYQTSIGFFQDTSGHWIIPRLAPNEVATLEQTQMVFEETTPIRIKAQILQAAEPDIDSSPNNYAGCPEQEDDEATLNLQLNPTLSDPTNRLNGAEAGPVFIRLIYPSPAMHQVSLQIISKEAFETPITVFSQKGQLIRQEPLQLQTGYNLIQWDIRNWPPGVYYIYTPRSNGVQDQLRFLKIGE